MEVLGFPDTSPASIVLQHIRRHGKVTIKELEHVLGVSTTAVREHLYHLQSQGLLETSSVRYGPGRPRLVYTLTDKAQKLFPNHYDLLINLLLQEIANEEGVGRVEQLLERVSTRLANEYTDRMSGEDILTRLGDLRTMLEDTGIPAEVPPTGDGIHIYACPFHDVAQEHAEVCAMDRQMLEQVLGQEVVQAHSIRDGHHTCCFNLGEKTESTRTGNQQHHSPQPATRKSHKIHEKRRT
jgi:DeoR family transcriptional regulator, suf operon transcriptional repressor